MAVHRIAAPETVCKDVCCGRSSDVCSFVFRHAYIPDTNSCMYLGCRGLFTWITLLIFLYFAYLYMDHFAYLIVLCLPLYGSLCLPYCTLPTSIWITWLTLLVYCTLPTSIWITWLTLLYFAYLCMDHFAYLTALCLPMDHFAYLTVLCLPLYGSLGLPYCTRPTSVWITLLTLLYFA